MDVAITELEKIDADRIDGVSQPANGIPILMLKQIADPEPEPVEKDWAEWDAEHEGGGGGRAGTPGNTRADAADAVARARQTIADHKAGKKVSAAELRNAHEVHEAHEAHMARLAAEGKGKAKGGRPHAGHAAPHAARPAAPVPPAAKSEFDPEAAKSLVRGIIKAADKRGKVDEAPDIAGGTAVLEQIADLIIAEAQELRAGQAGEIRDILELACAAEMIWCWRTGEEAAGSGSVQPATMLMQSAAGCGCCENCTAPAVKSGPTAAERRQAAAEGNALSDGSYPIRNEHELHAAAILARSGHGDVEGAKRLIARRARELGVGNPLDDDGDGDTGKSRLAEQETAVDTVTQDNGGQIAKAVEDAVTKAVGPLAKEIADLKSAKDLLAGELAKVKAMPVPGGPMLTSVTRRSSAPDGVNWAAKAAEYREKAYELTGDPRAAEDYRQLARQAEEKAKQPS